MSARHILTGPERDEAGWNKNDGHGGGGGNGHTGLGGPEENGGTSSSGIAGGGRAWILLLASGFVLLFLLATISTYRFWLDARADFPILSYLVGGAFILFFAVVVWIAIREASGLLKPHPAPGVRAKFEDATAAAGSSPTGGLDEMKRAVDALIRLYAGRDELADGVERLRTQKEDKTDPGKLASLARECIVDQLDREAQEAVACCARGVLLATAISSHRIMDFFAVASLNIKMLRQVASIYGGSGSLLVSAKTLRMAMLHFTGTGLVDAAANEVFGKLGGMALVTFATRIAEGIINGGLTLKLGLAAIEACRPMPFAPEDGPDDFGQRPSWLSMFKKMVTGFWPRFKWGDRKESATT